MALAAVVAGGGERRIAVIPSSAEAGEVGQVTLMVRETLFMAP